VASRIDAEFEDCGFSFWAVEVSGGSPFIGFVGLRRVPFIAPFTPAVEVGWRLAREHWGHGYVTEAQKRPFVSGSKMLALMRSCLSPRQTM